jgi:WD40 repeat protein
MSPVAELPVVKCSITRYSHAGGLLAAAGSSNTIFVYPAYYGHEGAAGRASSRPAGQSRSAAVAAGSGEGGAVLEAVAVLKGHVSSVTDLVFTGDDKRLVSTGAGGAVYFWDLSTGTRLTELEYVDKKCLYCSGVLVQAVQCISQGAALCMCVLSGQWASHL